MLRNFASRFVASDLRSVASSSSRASSSRAFASSVQRRNATSSDSKSATLDAVDSDPSSNADTEATGRQAPSTNLDDILGSVSAVSLPGSSAADVSEAADIASTASSSFRSRTPLVRGSRYSPAAFSSSSALAHRLHISTSRNNTILTLTSPTGDPLASASGGSVGFKKSARSGYEAGYRAAFSMFAKINEFKDAWRIMHLEVFWNGFGQGREAVYRAMLAGEGQTTKSLVTYVSEFRRCQSPSLQQAECCNDANDKAQCEVVLATLNEQEASEFQRWATSDFDATAICTCRHVRAMKVVHDLSQARRISPVFRHFNFPVVAAEICGMVVGIIFKNAAITLEVDDGTAVVRVRISESAWTEVRSMGPEKDAATKTGVPECYRLPARMRQAVPNLNIGNLTLNREQAASVRTGDVVKCRGKIQIDWEGNRCIIAEKLGICKDPSDECRHHLMAMSLSRSLYAQPWTVAHFCAWQANTISPKAPPVGLLRDQQEPRTKREARYDIIAHISTSSPREF
ncbi:hypothetical protein BCV70DRAFT_231689 [Testicularia cyperi]|uniref:Uncharacterized protein n=1 Tax=Testicularia cyperi TaxID=1882483 RepID=A0A317XP08_9BASI|nr:hypothetical protein BCV70DRAFT_231689 [Testicularia cyperi]